MSAWILSLEPEHRRTDGSPPRRETWRPPEFCATLKLLAALVVRRRNVPPSSKVSKQWPRSCGLRSDAPSRASCPSPATPHRSRATDPPHSWLGRRGAVEDGPHRVTTTRPLQHGDVPQYSDSRNGALRRARGRMAS